MSTYLELCQKLPKMAGITGYVPVTVTSQTGILEKICTWVADADVEIQRHYHDFPFLEKKVVITTSSGTAEYSLSTLGITDLNSWQPNHFVLKPNTTDVSTLSEMKYYDWRTSDARLANEDNDEPTSVIIKPDNTVVFSPTPDATYTSWGWYYKVPTKMTTDSSTSDIPSQFEDVILHLAKKKYAQYYGDTLLMQIAERDYYTELNRLIANQFTDRTVMSAGESDPYQNVVVTV